MEPGLARAANDTVADACAEAVYNELSPKPFDPDLLDVLAVACAGRPVLDVWCCPAHVARYLHERGVRAPVVDLSPEMVASPSSDYR